MVSKAPQRGNVESALDAFAKASDAQLLQASDLLLGANALVAIARDSRMQAGLAHLLEAAGNGKAGSLRYLARLWHMTAQAPLNAQRPEFVRRLRPLARPNGRLSDLTDPNDRRYAAEALTEVAGDWLPEFAAEALVQEEAGERARAALAQALLFRTSNLNAALHLIAEALDDLNFTTRDRGSSRARRMVRVLDAIGEALVEVDPAVEDGIGAEVAAFLDAGLRREAIGEPEAAAELAAAVLGFLRTIVRFHGTLAAEHRTFDAVARLRRLVQGTDWPEQAAGEAAKLARAVREALLFLARQDIADDPLRRVHGQLLGEVTSGLQLKQAVGAGHGLPSGLASWLVSGKMPKVVSSTAALEAGVLDSIDLDLARAFREGSELRNALAITGEEIVDAAREYSEGLGERTQAILDRMQRVLRSIDAAAESRGFRLRGQPGGIVEFAATDHETADGGPASRTVRLRNRLVERTRDASSVTVVLKAEVDRV